MRVTSWPASAMRPALAASSPESMLTRVDLPAPLVPITAWTSPSCRSRSTPPTAVSPPKRRVRPRTESSAASAMSGLLVVDLVVHSSALPCKARQPDQPHQSFRQQGHKHDDGDRKSTRLNSSHLVISYA